MVLHHQSYTLNREMSSPVHTHPDPQKKDLACEKNLPFFESFKHQNRSVFCKWNVHENSKKDTVDVQISFKRILLWDISTLQAHPLKRKYPLSGRLFCVSSQWRGLSSVGFWSFHGLENCQTERTQGHLQCIETLAGMRVRGKKICKNTPFLVSQRHTTLLINFFTQKFGVLFSCRLNILKCRSPRNLKHNEILGKQYTLHQADLSSTKSFCLKNKKSFNNKWLSQTEKMTKRWKK